MVPIHCMYTYPKEPPEYLTLGTIPKKHPQYLYTGYGTHPKEPFRVAAH